jgi:hypothetical protein
MLCSSSARGFISHHLLLMLRLTAANLHLSPPRFSAESFSSGSPSNTPLSSKLLSLLQEALGTHLLAELQRKLERLHAAALTPGALLLLRKGRR